MAASYHSSVDRFRPLPLNFYVRFIEADPDRWRVLRSEQAALIEDRETGAVLRAREANARTLHGPAPSAVVVR